MRFQSKSSFIYMFRNFGQLFFVTLPVSVILAFFATPYLETDLFAALFTGQLGENYFDAFASGITVLRFIERHWWYAIAALFALVLLAYTMCVMVVKINRHMRMGEMPTLPLKRAFGIFPMMLLYIVCWVLVSEVALLIIVGIVSMLRFLPSAEAMIGIGFGLTFVVRIFLTYIFGLLIITFPLKYSENYRFNVAMSYSARTMSAKRGKLILLSLAYAFARYAVMVTAYFARPLDVMVYAVANLLVLTFVPCFAFKQYHDEIGGERRDVSQIIFG